MKHFLCFVILAYFISVPRPIVSEELPEFEGVYLRSVTGELIEIPEVTMRGTVGIGSSTMTSNSRERFRTSVGWIRMNGLSQQDYDRLPRVSYISLVSGRTDTGQLSAASIVVNFRGAPRLQRVNDLVRADEIANRIEQGTRAQGLQGLVDQTNTLAGEVRYGSPAAVYVDNGWGVDTSAVFRSRVLSERSTEYVLRDPTRARALRLFRHVRGSGDPYGDVDSSMPVAGRIILLEDGRRFAFRN